MKGVIFRNPTISDCDLCCAYNMEDEHDCEHCVIVSKFNTYDIDKCEACVYHEECERKSDPCWA